MSLRLLMSLAQFATFRSASASYECTVSGTLKTVRMPQGGSWLDWVFWK